MGVVGVVGAAELELLLELGVGVGSTPVEVAVGSALAEVVAEPMTVVVGGGSELLAVAGVVRSTAILTLRSSVSRVRMLGWWQALWSPQHQHPDPPGHTSGSTDPAPTAHP